MSLIEMLQTLLAKPSEDITDADVDALDAAFATLPPVQVLIALRVRHAVLSSEASPRLQALNIRLIRRPGFLAFTETVEAVKAAHAQLPPVDVVACSRATTPLDETTLTRFVWDLAAAHPGLVAKVAAGLTGPVRQSLQASPSWPDLVATYPALAGA